MIVTDANLPLKVHCRFLCFFSRKKKRLSSQWEKNNYTSLDRTVKKQKNSKFGINQHFPIG
ncbi:Uncharacterized protein APZ42_021986 [Daphnia magna]|uniref:Uncharacterized protein n=1 Tax=Daphnia magna TaxID=35525 RepID=A0A164W6F5_9CRUS|nr:Uncharacterized protein APZ42_021986 [Daphnia magna]